MIDAHPGKLRQPTQQLFGGMAATDARPKPRTLADFECQRELGRGGNAAVYVARCKTTGQRVALKVIQGDARADAKYLARFYREVSNASVLVHPHVCRVFCFGAEGNVMWLAMELIEGGTIRDLIDRAGRLPPQIAALLTAQLLDALDAAHAAGIVHRDIKPANVMVTSTGNVKLIDFGIAKSKEDPIVTETGLLVGTPGYMSPEHVVGRDLDARTDLYAVGISLYEMLLGDNPYVHDTPSQALLRIALETLPSIFEQDPTVPGAIEAVFEHLTERRVEDRVASAQAALAELHEYVQYVQLVYPGLLAQFVADPVGVCASLRGDQAELEVARAESLLLSGDANLAAAGLAFFRAQTLQQNAHVLARFDAVCARGKLCFGADDDEPLVREVLARLLRLRGHEVAQAASAMEALEIAARQPFDAVLTDLGMPGMNGRALALALHERYPGLPVMLLTGDTEAGTPDTTIAAVLTKPFRADDVERALQKVLR